MTFHNRLDIYCNHTVDESKYKTLEDMDDDQRKLHPEGVICNALSCMFCLEVTTPCTISENCKHYVHF